MRSTLHALLGLLVLAAPLPAQHENHVRHDSPYADQQESGIAALSVEEVRQLREGAGMGLARAAELNRFPGPKHVLELAAELVLTREQQAAVASIHAQMLARAVRLGAQMLEAEEHLQRRFAHRHVDERSLGRATAEIARLQGELRFAHLRAHLQTTALLDERQIDLYDQLRGYG